MISIHIILYCFSTLLISKYGLCNWIRKSGTCNAETDQGSINLERLPTTQFPATDPNGNPYVFNPCNFFTVPEDPNYACQNVILCQNYHGTFFPLAKLEETQFRTPVDNSDCPDFLGGFPYEIYYENQYQGSTRTTHVQLICDKQATMPTLTAYSQFGDFGYCFSLRSKYACPQKEPLTTAHPPNDDEGISFGGVLLIIFFVGLTIYLVGGMLYLYKIKEARGIELIPNLSFWKEIPYLVKDGCKFVIYRGDTTKIYGTIK